MQNALTVKSERLGKPPKSSLEGKNRSAISKRRPLGERAVRKTLP
jgi:hypothetical protein